MSQGYRIAQFEEIEKLLDRVRDAHEADETSQAEPVGQNDRLERTSGRFRGPDVHSAFTRNLEVGPFRPERLAQQRKLTPPLVKAEPGIERETQARLAGLEPEWQKSERALEQAVDYNEEVLVPNAKHQVTTGAVAELAASADEPATVEDASREPRPNEALEPTLTAVRPMSKAGHAVAIAPEPTEELKARTGSAFDATAIVRQRRT